MANPLSSSLLTSHWCQNQDGQTTLNSKAEDEESRAWQKTVTVRMMLQGSMKKKARPAQRDLTPETYEPHKGWKDGHKHLCTLQVPHCIMVLIKGQEAQREWRMAHKDQAATAAVFSPH
ncbi:hypothetical protein MHYP_G00023650 [Metynnis hypsauchen]